MNISCTPSGVVVPKYPNQGFHDLILAGFDTILLNLQDFCEFNFGGDSRGEIWFLDERVTEQYIQGMNQNDIRCHVVYAPCLPRDIESHKMLGKVPAENWNEIYSVMALRSIRVAGKVEAKYVVIRPMFYGIDKTDVWKINREFYMRLAQVAVQEHVTILLENQCIDMHGHLVRGLCADAYDAAYWVDELNREAGDDVFGFAMDTAVYNLCGQDMQAVMAILGDRIKAIVIRECDGQTEAAMLPFSYAQRGRTGTDWLSLVRGAREMCFDGELIIDARDTLHSFSPLLRPQLLSLIKSVAEYFKWQIDIEKQIRKYKSENKSIVLFGAGNMCRNYLKLYGEEYRPLFTCDNNKALWGTTVCGLEVKTPEALRDLPEDVPIIICNIYYRQIEEQIRNMNLKNPIEYFSDEYMPSYDL